MKAQDFIDSILSSVVRSSGIDQASRREGLIALYDGTNSGRAAVLSSVIGDQAFVQAEYSKVFVLMQYFGYMRRNPNDPPDTDFSGWQFWLDKLNQFNGNFVNAEMVRAFIISTEYRQRFGP